MTNSYFKITAQHINYFSTEKRKRKRQYYEVPYY